MLHCSFVCYEAHGRKMGFNFLYSPCLIHIFVILIREIQRELLIKIVYKYAQKKRKKENDLSPWDMFTITGNKVRPFFPMLGLMEIWCQPACPSPAIPEQMLIFQFTGLLRIHGKVKLYMRMRIFSSREENFSLL